MSTVWGGARLGVTINFAFCLFINIILDDMCMKCVDIFLFNEFLCSGRYYSNSCLVFLGLVVWQYGACGNAIQMGGDLVQLS